MKIIIVNSYEYFGGTLVLSSLCRHLSGRGYDARLFMIPRFPTKRIGILYFWYSWFRHNCGFKLKKIMYYMHVRNRYFDDKFYKPIICNHTYGCKIEYNPFFNKSKTIVVYPEVVFGNFLNAKNVVRWLLYFYNYHGDLNAYSKDDLFICYRKIFNSIDLNPLQKEVNIFDFNSKLYYQYNFSNRSGICYLIRKGKTRKDLPKSFKGKILDDCSSEKEMVQILNESKYCYIYDTQTFYATIAAVCGCIPIVMIEEGKCRADYLVGDDSKGYGIAYGNTDDEIEFAIRTRDKLLQSLDFTQSNNININRFIFYLEDYFKCKLSKTL